MLFGSLFDQYGTHILPLSVELLNFSMIFTYPLETALAFSFTVSLIKVVEYCIDRAFLSFMSFRGCAKIVLAY